LTDNNSELSAAVFMHLAHDRLLTAMRVVESLPPSACGALMVETRDETLGTILVESNRVCWGAAPGMGPRFRDILLSHCDDSIQEQDIEAVCQRCKRDSQPLSETLVDNGWLSPAQMRAAIKQHTIESLLTVDATVTSLCGSQTRQWPMRWIDHSGRGFKPRYTFGPVEVLEAAGIQRLDENDAEVMIDHLDLLADDRNALVAFSFQPDGTPIFVGTMEQLSLDTRDLVDLTTWADAALGASPGFSPEVAHRCARSSDGGTVAWRYQGQCCAAICVDGASLQRLTASLRNQSRAMVLATRTAVLHRVRERIREIHCKGE
jgi:hypothetical protein